MLLEVRGLEVGYGGIRAVRGIDLDIAAGELVCLIGANGAGKSSTLRAICGLLPVRAGGIRYAGEDTSAVPVHELPRKGLVMVPEGRGIFPQLTVEENLAMGAYIRNDTEISQDVERQYERFPRLKERRTQTAGTLSGGEQQMLAMGRALMARPRLLLLDEPSMGLAPRLVEEIFATIKALRAGKATIFLVDQNARAALSIADRGYVLETGRVVLAGTGPQLLADGQVREAYLGM